MRTSDCQKKTPCACGPSFHPADAFSIATAGFWRAIAHPIQYAFSYPERLNADFPRVNLFEYSNLTFEAPDRKNFRNLDIALSAITQGGTMPCIMNAANEVVVDAFLHDKISFFAMSDLIEKTMSHIHFVAEPTLQDYVETHQESMKYTQSLL